MGRGTGRFRTGGARAAVRLALVCGTGAAMVAVLALAAVLGGGGRPGIDAATRWLDAGGRWWFLAARLALAGLVWWRWAALVAWAGARGERAAVLAGRRDAYLLAYLLLEAMGPCGGMAFLVGLAV